MKETDLPINTRIYFINTSQYWNTLEEGAIVRLIGGYTYEVVNAGLRFNTARAVHGQDFITRNELIQVIQGITLPQHDLETGEECERPEEYDH